MGRWHCEFSHRVPITLGFFLEDLDLEGRLSLSTRQLYERNMTNLVLPPSGT